MNSTDFTLIDKLPQSIELEVDVLASIYLDGGNYHKVADIINAYDFANPHHTNLFHAMTLCLEKNRIITPELLKDFITSNNLMEKIGGEITLITLQNHVPSFRKLATYCKQIKVKSTRRKQITLSVELIGKLKEDFPETDQEVDGIISSLKDASYKPLEQVYVDFADVNNQFVAKITQAEAMGIGTGFHQLDEVTGGFRPKTLTTLAAETSFGKTTFAFNIAFKMALEKNKIAYLSLEMTNEELAVKANSMMTGLSYMDLIQRRFQDADWETMQMYSQNAVPHNHLFMCECGLDISQIVMTTRHLKQQKGIKVLIIDHLQFIKGKKNAENRNLEISHYTHTLKELAKELDIAILILSQLNRGNTLRADKRPFSFDLRDSNSIAQDSDNIWFLFKESAYNKEFEDKNQVELIIRKNRGGERDVAVFFDFNGKTSTFLEKPNLPQRV
jgi:replicative DNA helicase